MLHRRIRVAGSGSGTRYGVQIGAFCELTDMGIEIEEAVLSSGSAIAGACKAAAGSSKRMEEMACDLLPREHLVPNLWPFGGERGAIGLDSLRDAFTKNIGLNIESLDRPRLHIVTSKWATGETVVWTKGPLALALSASMCLPIFDMVKINGELYEDPGLCGANFLVDYDGWHNRGSLPLIGLRVHSANEPAKRPRPKTKVDRAMGSVDNLIAANDREHIEDARGAKVITLETAAPGLNLLLGPDQMRAMIKEGRAGIRRAVIEGKLG